MKQHYSDKEKLREENVNYNSLPHGSYVKLNEGKGKDKKSTSKGTPIPFNLVIKL